MTNMTFEPSPESPIGMPITFLDPDLGRPTDGVIAADNFRVKVTAGHLSELPGFGIYVPTDDRAVFGFMQGISDIEGVEGGVLGTEEIALFLMSRYEAPLSVVDYGVVLERTLTTGRFIVTSGLSLM